jgi:hypothetical protein
VDIMSEKNVRIAKDAYEQCDPELEWSRASHAPEPAHVSRAALTRLRAGVVLAAALLLVTAIPATASLTNNTIGSTGTLGPQGRTASMVALIECTAGQTIKVRVTLTQAKATGEGMGGGTCTGTLTEYPVRVASHRGAAFTSGPALACASAVNRDGGHVGDTKQWCRADPVQLTG